MDKDVSPVQLPPRKPPVALREKYKEELERLTKLKVIEPISEPTDWVSSTVLVVKESGKLRCCIDPKPLNTALKRSHYPLGNIEDVLPDLSNAKVFSVADVKNGFWHVVLEEESSKLTTFATPWGRYKWNCMPFGISVAPEEFQKRLNDALIGLQGIQTVADDVLIYGTGDTYEEALKDHDDKLERFLKVCQNKGIKLNREKLKLRLEEVRYVGHVISATGLKPDPRKIDAVVNMPAPEDKQGVRRLMGTINYLQKFAPCLAEVTGPIRQLVKKENEFNWDESIHGKCFDQIKKLMTQAPVLRFFDPKIHTVLQCDASQFGLGACILQQGQPVGYASRAMTATESEYAQIEKELLAIVFAVERFDTYVYGRKITIETDHKPLESIFKKSLQSSPRRLQKMLLCLQKYDINIVYKRGIELYLADTLSRAFLQDTDDKRSIQQGIESICMLEYLSVSEVTRNQIKEAMNLIQQCYLYWKL